MQCLTTKLKDDEVEEKHKELEFNRFTNIVFMWRDVIVSVIMKERTRISSLDIVFGMVADEYIFTA